MINYEKLIYKFAYDAVDNWSFSDLVEYAENSVINEGLIKMRENPDLMIEEMKEFWLVDDLSEINPDDFKV
jgi:hypothetical protein